MSHHDESHQDEPEQTQEQADAGDEESEIEAHILGDKVFVDRPEES